jgi:3-methyladenine DNA glycosylase AlkD
MIIDEIVSLFEENTNNVNAVKMAAYMKNKFLFYGIKSPLRKELEKDFIKEFRKAPFSDCIKIVNDLYKQEYRELHYFAMDIVRAKKKFITKQHVDLAESLIVKNSWWDSVDFLATHLYNPVLQDMNVLERNHHVSYLSTHNNLWLNRVAIIFQLPLKDKTNTDLLEKAILPHIDSKEFFRQKAIGWALRQYSKTDSEYVRKFLASHSLSNLAIREASKYL